MQRNLPGLSFNIGIIHSAIFHQKHFEHHPVTAECCMFVGHGLPNGLVYVFTRCLVIIYVFNITDLTPNADMDIPCTSISELSGRPNCRVTVDVSVSIGFYSSNNILN